MNQFLSRTTSLLLGFLTCGPFLSAAPVTFSTAQGSSIAAGAVSASATFTTTTGLLTIVLRDLLANPTSAGQLVSDLSFTLSTPLAGGTVFTSSAQQITIDSLGIGALGQTGPTGWGYGMNSVGYTVCVICPAGYALAVSPEANPSQTIIGPGPYTKANGSIAGNPAHNSFLNGTATFKLANSAILASTTVSNVIFSFGTKPGVNVPGIGVDSPLNFTADVSGDAVPEPSTAWLLAIGGLLVGVRTRR